jgi:hypothetical protein
VHDDGFVEFELTADGLVPRPRSTDGPAGGPAAAREPSAGTSARPFAARSLADDAWFAAALSVSKGRDVHRYRRRDELEPAHHTVTVTWSGAYDASFVRVVDIPRELLASALRAWWRDSSAAGLARVDRFLRLGEPLRGIGSWRIAGRLRRPVSPRWLPIEVELWPHHDRWTRLTVVPRSRVRPSRLYFRAGNRAVDRFTDGLMAYLPAMVRPAVALGG